jgi:hypothetical protein
LAETRLDSEHDYFKSSDLAERLSQAFLPTLWESICPGLSVSNILTIERPAPRSLPANEWSRLEEQVVTEGYFEAASILPSELVERLAAAVTNVVTAGYHPLFSTVYDEMWQMLAMLDPVLEPILGPGARVVPDYWVWRVDGRVDQAGWAPHRDLQFENTLRSDGRPTIVTVWIPLTDATPRNSCIYVLPLSRDANYPANLKSHSIDRPQDIRALPVGAGSILGWNQYLLHWGSRASGTAGDPRISIGIYFQASDVPPFSADTRDVLEALTFDARLGFIGAALLRYGAALNIPRQVLAFAALALGRARRLPVREG